MTFCLLNPPLSVSVSTPYTTLALCLWYSVDEAATEDQQSDQRHSSDPETEIQSTPGLVDQEQQQQQQQHDVLEDGPPVLNRAGNTSHHHQEQQVSSFAIFVKFNLLWK